MCPRGRPGGDEAEGSCWAGGGGRRGIMKIVPYVGQLVQEEVDMGVEVGRIVVGRCAVPLTWGLVSGSK